MTAATSRVTDYSLFIPGPVPVADDVLAAMSTQVYGHRSGRYKEAHARLRPLIQELFRTRGRVLGLTCPGTGPMEMLTRQSVRPGRRMVNLVNGAFAERWHALTGGNGVSSTLIDSEWGEPLKLDVLEAELAKGDVDAVTITYSETSTGMLNPVQKVVELARSHPDTLVLVDAVSAVGGVPLEFEAWGLDAAFAGVQKALACPPGFAVMALSERMEKRAKEVPQSGWLWDHEENIKKDDADYALATPSLSHMAALTTRLEYMKSEGFDEIVAHTAKLSARCQEWAKKHFSLFPPEDAMSPTLTAIKMPENYDTAAMLKRVMTEEGFEVGNGYGKLKNKTIRIGHMGECRMENLEEVLAALEKHI